MKEETKPAENESLTTEEKQLFSFYPRSPYAFPRHQQAIEQDSALEWHQLAMDPNNDRTFNDGELQGIYYFGEVVDNKPDGRGIGIYKSGLRYDG